MSQSSSFCRLAFCCGGSTWPCVTWLCSLWDCVCVVVPIVKYLDVFRNFNLLPHCPVVAVHMTIDFLDDCLDKFLRVGLSELLLKIHDVTHHLCMESNRVSHLLLKLKMGVLEEVFIRLARSSLGWHVVHTLISIEIPLGHEFCHSLWHGANSSRLTCTNRDSRLSWCHSLISVRSLGLLRSATVLWHQQIHVWDAVVIWRVVVCKWLKEWFTCSISVFFRWHLRRYNAVLFWHWHLGKNHACTIQIR